MRINPIKISIFVICFALTGLVISLLSSSSTRQTPVNTNVQTPEPTEISSGINTYKKYPDTEKSYKNRKLIAYRISLDNYAISGDTDMYIITQNLTDMSASYVVGTSNNAFESGNLFDIVGDNLYQITAQENAIVKYNLKTIESTQNIYFDFEKIITLPKSLKGTIYSIKCSENQCKIRTAGHIESGCNANLNTTNDIITNIKCSEMRSS